MTPPVSTHEKRAKRQASARWAPARWGLSLALGLAGLGGCASPGPAPSHYRLALDAPASQTPAETPTETPTKVPADRAQDIWQLQRTLRLPEYLDRDLMVLPGAEYTLEPQPGHRWAEPLRDAIPRVLQHDLAAWLHSSQVWVGTPPAAWPATRQIRIDIQAFEALPSRLAVRLQARWSIESLPGPHPPAPPILAQADLQVPSEGPAPAQLVQAHRLALWRLAECVARSAQAPQSVGASAP